MRITAARKNRTPQPSKRRPQPSASYTTDTISDEIKEVIIKNISAGNVKSVYQYSVKNGNYENEDRIKIFIINEYKKYLSKKSEDYSDFSISVDIGTPNLVNPVGNLLSTDSSAPYARQVRQFNISILPKEVPNISIRNRIMDKSDLIETLFQIFQSLNERGNFLRSDRQIQGMVQRCTRDFLSLPESAPELYRPRDPVTGKATPYIDPETKKPETIVRFLERVWSRWIAEGVLTRPEFRRLDPQGEMAIRNFLRDEVNKWPEHLHLPTKVEVVDAELSRADEFEEVLSTAARIRSGRLRRKENTEISR